VVAGALTVLEMLTASSSLRDRLEKNTKHYREKLASAGLTIKPGAHPIVPVMLGDAVVAQKMSARLLELGVYAVGFFYPVVPEGKARIRTQVSAAHTIEDLDFAVEQFVRAKKDVY
jgi:glycine C-acetyltransferase